MSLDSVASCSALTLDFSVTPAAAALDSKVKPLSVTSLELPAAPASPAMAAVRLVALASVSGPPLLRESSLSSVRNSWLPSRSVMLPSLAIRIS
ncbi:hypothetical protein D3C78_1374690 [compost metagenome]